MPRTTRLAIYALHPIMYQVPIFSALHGRIERDHLDMKSTVLFGDDLSLKNVFYEETKVVFRPDTPNLLEGYRHHFLKNMAKDPRGGFLSRINFGILSYLVRNKIDVVLIHGYETFTAWLALFTARILGVKVIWRGEVVPRKSGPLWKQKAKKFLLKQFFNSCDAALYSCSGNKAYLKEYGVPESRLFFIPCAVDNDFFGREWSQLKPKRDEIRASLGIDAEAFVVLFCARFTARKRPMDLIDSLEVLKHDKIVALFVGDGPEKQTLMEAAKAKGVRAVFVGFKNQSEVGRYYSIADVATVISSYDPSPKAMNEAMNFALPIIVTEVVGTAHDLLIPGRNGFILKTGDVAGLAKALSSLAADKQLALSMGQQSQNIVSEWNYEKDVDGVFNAIGFVLKSSVNSLSSFSTVQKQS